MLISTVKPVKRTLQHKVAQPLPYLEKCHPPQVHSDLVRLWYHQWHRICNKYTFIELVSNTCSSTVRMHNSAHKEYSLLSSSFISAHQNPLIIRSRQEFPDPTRCLYTPPSRNRGREINETNWRANSTSSLYSNIYLRTQSSTFLLWKLQLSYPELGTADNHSMYIIIIINAYITPSPY